MSFASDRLYKTYLVPKMATIVSRVKVREIVAHLPCLTDHDRETIEAKRETSGNYNGMVLLLDCLKRRENWPEQFIEALEACDHPTLAAEMRREYNALRGLSNSNPSSPPTTVVTAHVHPAPSASHVSTPGSGGNSQAVVAPPAPQPSPPVEIPAQPQTPQSSAAPVPAAVSPPEPLQSTRPKATPAPSTPPPSPETPHAQSTSTTPPPRSRNNFHQEPVENSESDIQAISGDNGVSAGNGEVSINSVDTPPSSSPDHLQTTPTAATVVRPPQSPSPTQINSDVTDGSSFPVMTPEKPPVQDTTPPTVVLQPEETSEPPANQVVESRPQTETAASASPLLGAAERNVATLDDTSVCLSKPGQLISIQPQNDSSSTIAAPTSPMQPYSGNSDRLEISSLSPGDTVTTAPCQENGIAHNHNEPEENQYESPCQSLEVRVNVVQISEEPSILNLDGQSSAPQAQIVNGEAAKEITSAPPQTTNAAETVSNANSPSSENYHPSDPAPADKTPGLQDPEDKTSSHILPANTKYILTAAGVGACALLMAWKFKN